MGLLRSKVHLSDNRTWNQTTTDRHDRSLQHSTVVILGQDCSVQIGQVQATREGAGHTSNTGGWEEGRAEGVVVVAERGRGL